MGKLSTVPPTTQDIVGSNSLANLADPVLLAEHEAATAALNTRSSIAFKNYARVVASRHRRKIF
jgi:hypothetical protein